MKKCLMVFVISLLALTSCDVTSNRQSQGTTATITTTQYETTASATASAAAGTTAISEKEKLSMRLAEVIKEDGTGVIRPNMPSDEIAKQLDELGIPYTRLSSGARGITFSDGSFCLSEDIGLQQTSKGLKIGDPSTKVEKLYGKVDLTRFNGFIYYSYDFGTKDQYGNKIELQISLDNETANAKVQSIVMHANEPHELGAGS